MQLKCPQCGKQLGSKHVNQELKIVTCDNCDAVFSVPEISHQQDAIPTPPEQITVMHNSDYRLVRYKEDGCIPGCTGILFLPITISMLWSVWQTPSSSGVVVVEGILKFGMMVYLLVILLHMITKLLNSSIIEMNHGWLRVKRRPIPFPFDTSTSLDEIRDVYTKHIIKGKYGVTIIYGLHIIKTNGEHRKLLTFGRETQAIYVQNIIKTFLTMPEHSVKSKI